MSLETSINFPNFWPFTNSYINLPDLLFQRIKPTTVRNPKIIKLNKTLSDELNLSNIDQKDLTTLLSGNYVPNNAKTIALAYAGHQFGSFVPSLGDGRAILLGELKDNFGKLKDLQLKGSGKTMFSRGGDGRSPLGPVVREYIISEAMHSLSIPSTRSLAALSTGETVNRDRKIPGGILARVASSHIRVGTFQYCQAKNDINSLKKLCHYTVQRLYPHIEHNENPYLDLLKELQKKQISLISKWMSVGFIHGVMNTDNTSVFGETIDFGPCAFLDEYDPNKVFSSIDYHGRYSFNNQPGIAQWNLARFAESILPLIHNDTNKSVELANEVINKFPEQFKDVWLDDMRRKIGLISPQNSDEELINKLLKIMSLYKLDFTETFRNLGQGYISKNTNNSEIDDWIIQWSKRIKKENKEITKAFEMMNKINPVYIPRNHLVETVINDIIEGNNYKNFDKFNKLLSEPFTVNEKDEFYSPFAKPEEKVTQTFCGT